MKRSGLLAVLFLACVFFLMAGNSQAVPIYGEFWDGGLVAGASDIANNPSLGTGGLGVPTATFTVNALNFDSRPGNPTYQSFLAGGAGNPNGLVWLTDPLTIKDNLIYTHNGFLGTPFQFDWNQFVTTNESLTVTHDNGFNLRVGSVNYNYSTPVSPTTNIFPLTNSPSGIYHFTMIYGETNELPAVLQLPTSPVSVPEPGILILLGIAMSAIGAASWRLRKL